MHLANPLCELPREEARRIDDWICWDVGILVCWTRSETLAGLGAVAVVEEWATERDRYTPWLHRAVQGRVAGPLVQLRFISLISQSSADQQSVSRHTKVLLISLNSFWAEHPRTLGACSPSRLAVPL